MVKVTPAAVNTEPSIYQLVPSDSKEIQSPGKNLATTKVIMSFAEQSTLVLFTSTLPYTTSLPLMIVQLLTAVVTWQRNLYLIPALSQSWLLTKVHYMAGIMDGVYAAKEGKSLFATIKVKFLLFIDLIIRFSTFHTF